MTYICEIILRNALPDSWATGGFAVHAAYMAVNISCLEFWKLTTAKIGRRAANLARINMAPLFVRTHLIFLSSLFGVYENFQGGSELFLLFL